MEVNEPAHIHDCTGVSRFAALYNADADYVAAFNFLVEDKIVELTTTSSELAPHDGKMRWTWKGDPLTADTPALQKLLIERL